MPLMRPKPTYKNNQQHKQSIARTFFDSSLLVLVVVAGYFAAQVTYYSLPDKRTQLPIISERSGAWSSPNTWQNGTVPSQGDVAMILPEHQVLFDLPANYLGDIHIEGNITLDPYVAQQIAPDTHLSGTVHVLGSTSAASMRPFGDMNEDGVVNELDVSVLLSPNRWGSTDTQADLNNDGTVSIYDLSKAASLLGAQ